MIVERPSHCRCFRRLFTTAGPSRTVAADNSPHPNRRLAMTLRFSLAACLAAATLLAPAARADIRLPALFTDHMVLQQGQTNRVWGWADPGEDVIVTIAGQKQTAKADAKGKWLLT